MISRSTPRRLPVARANTSAKVIAAWSIALALASMLFTARVAHAEVRARLAEAGPRSPAVTLYTIGPGSYLYALQGHSVLCIDDDCYDYGVATHNDPLKLFWHGMRGVPDFAPITVARERVLRAFQGEERRIDVQQIPLRADRVAVMVARLDREVRNKTAYAYNPWFANCTTQLRDVIDEASEGALRRVTELDAPLSFRTLSERNFSGRLLPLMGMMLGVGQGERVGSPYERMFIPTSLQEGVSRALGAAPSRVYEARGVQLASSPNAGRIMMVLLGAMIAAVVAFSTKRPGKVSNLVIATGSLWLGAFGLIVWMIALLSHFPEIARNWNVALLVPFDLIVPPLARANPAAARRYLEVRLGLIALLLVLSLTGLIAQPLLVVSLFAGLPLLAIYRAKRRISLPVGARGAR